MSKKDLCKKVIGICLVAMMAVAGVGKYAKADTVPIVVRGNDGVIYHLTGGTVMSQTRGTSYTEEDESNKCHCSVSATFRWYDCKFRMNGTPVTLQRCEGFASSVCQALTPAY